MVGMSHMICLMTGLQRVAKNLVSTASMIFWMMVRSSSSVSK